MEVSRTALSGHEQAVRTLTRAYFEEINELGRDWYDDDTYGVDVPSVVGSDVERLRSEPLATPLFLVLRDGQAVGMGQLHRHDEHLVTAKRVFVRPAHRGEGLGRALVERLLVAAAADGFDRLHLNVSPYHQRARALYDSLGFESVSPPAWTTVSTELHDEWLFLERDLGDG